MSFPDRPVLTLTVHILDTFQAYLRDNRLAAHEARFSDAEMTDRMPDYIVAPADGATADPADPGAIILDYDHPDCGLSLPAGRQTKIGQIGGVVAEIEHIFPLEPLTWEATEIELARLIALLDGAGWQRSTGYFTPNVPVQDVILPRDFAAKSGPKWASVGYWAQCDTADIKAYLEIRHYNSGSPGAFVPPAPLSDPIDDLAEDRFLFLIRFETEIDGPRVQEMTQLRTARRMAVNGNPDQEIPLWMWITDPDWRPEGWQGTVIK